MSNHGNPLKPKKEKIEKDTELALFKKDKPTLPTSEAKKLLNWTKPLSKNQTMWVQRWMEHYVRGHCLPPQLSGADALGEMNRFLSPRDCLQTLEYLRRDFHQTLEREPSKTDDEFAFLMGLGELEAYHAPLYQSEDDAHNTH